MKKLLFISMFAALLAVGCEEADGFDDEQTPPGDEQTPGDNNGDDNDDAEPTVIRLSTNIEVLTRTAFPALDTQIAKDEQVAVWVDNSTDGSQLYGKNVLTADGNGGLTGGTPMYFPQNDDKVNIYALHTNASLSGTGYPTEAITHTVSTDQRTQANYAASDLLYATVKNVSKTNNAVSLTFRHLLSKVQLALVLTDGLTAADIQSVCLSGLKTSANLSLNKNAAPEELTVEAAGATADINIGTDVSADFTDSGVQYNEAVVVPQAVDAQTALLTVTLNDGTVLVFYAPADTAFESGKKYALQMSISRSGIKLSTSVSDWEPGDDLFPGGGDNDGEDKEVGGIMYIAPECDLADNQTLTDYINAGRKYIYIALKSGGKYALSAPIDFGASEVKIYSVDSNSDLQTESDKHAIIEYGQNGVFRTGNSLTLKNLSIDATEHFKPDYNDGWTSRGWGIVEGSSNATALDAASQLNAASQADWSLNNYLLENITFDGCYIKNLNGNLAFSGEYAWVFGTFKVTNSIIQLYWDGTLFSDSSVFGSYGGGIGPNGETNWRMGAIRELIVENSTIYNIFENDRTRMIRWLGNSVTHHFTEGTQVSITFNRVTLSQTFTGKEFANGTWNKPEATITFTNSVYRDCFRVFNKMNVRSCTSTISNNLGWWTGTMTKGDYNVAAGDMENDASVYEEYGYDAAIKWASFTFAGDVNKELDFTAANGYGTINFKASAATATQGDPRWK